MKKIFLCVLVIGFLLFNSCASNKAGLVLLDEPIRIGYFGTIISNDHPLVQVFTNKNTVKYDYVLVYQYMVEILFDQLPYFSNLVEKETGFPLDLERFYLEFKETAFANVTLARMEGFTMISWWAEYGGSSLYKNDEPWASIALRHKVIRINKNGKNRNEKIDFPIKF